MKWQIAKRGERSWQIWNNKLNVIKTITKNASYKSALKTAIKNVRAEVEAGNKEAAEKALVIASSKLDSYVNKGIHHKNYAIRQKSKLAKLVNSI